MNADFRALCPNERLYLAALRDFPPLCIQMIVEGVGHLDETLLTKAIETAALDHPGCRLRLDGNRWLADGPLPSTRVLGGLPNLADGADTIDVLNEPLNPHTGPTCSVVLWRAADRVTLAFRASHAVMDAQGLKMWALDVLRALRDESVIGAPDGTHDHDVVETLGDGRRSSEPWWPACAAPTSGTSNLTTQFVTRRRSFQGHAPGAVARAIVATRRSLDIAAQQRFIAMVPVDLRGLSNCPRPASTANLSLPLFLSVGAKEAWHDVYQRLLSSLNAGAHLGTGGGDWFFDRMSLGAIRWFLRAAFRVCAHRGRFPISTVVSHVGRLSLDEFGCDDFHATSGCFLPVSVPLAPLSIVITEHDGGTDVTASAPKHLADQGLLDRALDAIGGELSLVRGSSDPRCVWHGSVSPSNAAEAAHVGVDPNEAIDHWAAREPRRVALIDAESGTPTHYSELVEARDRAAAILARVIRPSGRDEGSGIPPRVAILMDRSIDTVVAILATLRANACFVPIDPRHPVDRVTTLLRDADPSVVVTLLDHRDVPYLADYNVVNPSDWKSLNANQDIDSVDTTGARDPDSLAYILYTSGTTGTPKGVMITRRNLGTYLSWAHDLYFAPNGPHVTPLATSLSFDLTITSLLGAFQGGHAVKVYSHAPAPILLSRLLRDPSLTIVKLTPAHLDILCATPDTPASRWRCLIVGGEAFPTDLARRVRHKLGNQVTIYNEYGPTETTVGCSAHRFDPERDHDASVPIGLPGPEMSLYLLRPDGRPCRPGEEGDIVIGGNAVARGYWRRPELTSERFQSDPLRVTGDPRPARRYLSGDKGVTRHGQLHCLGRADDQVKINGHRVELEEIRSALISHPTIERAFVFATDHGGHKALRAFFTPRGTTPTVDSILEHLRSRLPSYMIPATFESVTSVPLTPNGKADVAALRALRVDSLDASATERAINKDLLAACWDECLDRKDAPRHFFNAGGDSLRLLNLVRTIDERVLRGMGHTDLMAALPDFWAEPTLDRLRGIVTHVSESLSKESPDLRRIRRASPDDREAIVPLMRSSADAMFHVVFRARHRTADDFLKAAFTARHTVWSHRFQWVVTLGDQVVTSASVYPCRLAPRLSLGALPVIISVFGWRRSARVIARAARCAALYPMMPRDAWYIANVGTSPDQRGRGHFSFLFESILGEARRQGVKVIALDVADDNPRAKALYERLGFRVTREVPYRGRWSIPGMRRMEFFTNDKDI